MQDLAAYIDSNAVGTARTERSRLSASADSLVAAHFDDDMRLRLHVPVRRWRAGVRGESSWAVKNRRTPPNW
ncbi:hypothetical protein GCM10009828_022460 [Actinoplanes couchii]|uniref:Uncharacterized protein n=1 Tax=Actinoplanes couchii TaxID=403638 RepID=A0ABQ3XSU9_9ACTN|nr:hypothetical protein Aco03nite_099870 [Actinoplanes couchii]